MDFRKSQNQKPPMSIVCIIPARLGSYRFPDKPFADICGISMIEHVWRRASLYPRFRDVYVATPNQEIAEHVEGFGGKIILTSDDVRRATDRVAEAASKIDDAEIIVNLQGDEPLVNADMFDQVLAPIEQDLTLGCVNLVRRVKLEEALDIHEVKVVFDENSDALYLSREPVPSKFLGSRDVDYFIEICIFPFTRRSLSRFAELPSTELEDIESIDMLRLVGHGEKVKIVETEHLTYSVDVPQDLDKVRALMEDDDLFQQYRKL